MNTSKKRVKKFETECENWMEDVHGEKLINSNVGKIGRD